MIHVTILALEQSIPSGILVIHDLLKMASIGNGKPGEKNRTPLFDVTIASADGKTLRYSEFLEIKPHMAVTEIRKTDLVIVPSGGYRINGLQGFPRVLTEWLRAQWVQGTDIAGICTGVFLLGEAGILAGKQTTTHWAYADLFRTRYPDTMLMPDRIITQDSGIFCSGGGSAGVDLTLFLIEKFAGPEPARRCMRMFLLERGRDDQSPYVDRQFKKNHPDAEILKAQVFIERKIAENIVMDDVAAHVGMSLRNFKRRFKSATGDPPLVYLQKLRMESARHVLERDDTRIDVVAAMVGYEDMGFFRKLFSRYTGLSPSDYRQKFRNACPVGQGQSGAVLHGSTPC